ncbi:serpin B [Crossiella equi]|uniref:Serpin B n=1 Tax=Crossiella equi TaxID=130796 RepID=A0ABS5ANJ9_9PSEU|nr:serpin family protein [Crossiella equi]MBP2478159.1 serpin B [Crossiella equi]
MLPFTAALHQALTGPSTTNAVWSPYSVASALTLLAHAARGASREELLALLGDQAALDEQVRAAAEVDRPEWLADKPLLAVTNTLWADDGLTVLPGFRDHLAGLPGSAVRRLALRAAPERARQAVNADVAETTHGLIPELVPPGTFTPDTLLALVNALYLRTAWQAPFERAGDAPFHAPGGPVEVPTMRLVAKQRHAVVPGWQVVTLRAQGQVEAAVLLPDGELPAELSAAGLSALLDAEATHRELDLRLPSFRLEAAFGLDTALRGVGVRTVFTAGADLGALTPQRAELSAALHRAVLTVDEKGLEGAAATVLVARAVAFMPEPEPPLPVRVDRPFLFVVRGRGSALPYFLARVVRP